MSASKIETHAQGMLHQEAVKPPAKIQESFEALGI
jgi:hypothetical protein